MTLKEIAQEAGVAVSTVSRVLNGTASISKPVSDKVFEIASRSGYIDKINKKSKLKPDTLTGKKLLIVTPRDAVLNRSDNMISYTLIESIKSLCNERGIKLTPFLTEPNRLSVQKLHDFLNRNTFDAILIVWADQTELLSIVSTHQLPTVLVNGEDRAMNVDSVGVSNRYGAMVAVNYLLNKGHSNVGILTYSGRQTIYLRESGYRDSLYNANINPIQEHKITADNFTDEAAEKAVTEWLCNKNSLPITALFCVTERLALGAVSALQKSNYKIPEDISIVSMDGILPLDLLEPQLTTMALPFEYLPSEALSILEQQIGSVKPRKYHIHSELSCNLVERKSVRELTCRT